MNEAWLRGLRTLRVHKPEVRAVFWELGSGDWQFRPEGRVPSPGDPP